MSNLKPFFASNLASIPSIAHGFFGREGGVSDGIYASLNCGYGSNDIPKNVKENRRRVAKFFGLETGHLLNPYQIHSADAQYIDKPFPKDGPRCDAFVTDKKDLALGILTADCAPILFADTASGVIGAAHAGWQGALHGIIEATLDLMVEKGAKRENIFAAIGPCINQESYEVGPEYRDRFINSAKENAQFFITGNDDKFQFDLKSYCAHRLKNAGITNIETLPHDTCALEAEFHSNRRRNQKGEPDYGRNIGVIVLK